jgi:hypothetical protein
VKKRAAFTKKLFYRIVFPGGIDAGAGINLRVWAQWFAFS